MNAFKQIAVGIKLQQPTVAELGFATYLLCDARCRLCQDRFNTTITKSDCCSLCDLRKEAGDGRS